MIIRRASPRDILRFSRYTMPRYAGLVAEENGVFMGMVAVIWGEKKRHFLVFEITGELRGRKHFMHRWAVKFMSIVGHRFSVIYTQASNDEPASVRWLNRLGFEGTDEILNGERVFKWQQSSEHLARLGAADLDCWELDSLL